jgi:hypothetical protein
MPINNIDYANTIIYKIVCNDLSITDSYVGHTTNFCQRKREHKNRTINEKNPNYNIKLYSTIRLNGGWINHSMIEIEKYPCNDANEAVAKERYYYEQLNSTLNSYFPCRSNEERNLTNKEKNNERSRLYHHNHKEEISVRSKVYRDNNVEKLKASKKEYYENNKETMNAKSTIYNKECRTKNRDEVLAKEKTYREINKEKINEQQKQTILCECGELINYYNRYRHLESKKHNKLMLCKDVVL